MPIFCNIKFLNAENGEPISNSVTFNGHSDSSGEADDNNGKNVSFSGGAGGKVFQTGTGKIKIKKVDVDDRTPLAGAVFELYDESETNLLDTLVTNDNGEAETTGKHKYKKYLIKEVTPPDGYISNSEYITGKVIVFDKNTANENFVYEEGDEEKTPYIFTNKKGDWAFELTKVDEDDQTQVLAGAKFKLQKETNSGSGVYVDVDPQPTNLTTDRSGKLRLSRDDVELDVNYRLIEIEAPIGYELDDTTTIQFKIAANQTQLEEKTMTNKAVTGGSVKLTKVDDVELTPLQEAEFKLEYNEGGTGNWVPVGSTYKTNANGELEELNLKGGQYRFIELSAPADYIRDDTPIEFEIVEGNQQVELTFENQLIPGSVKLIKIRENHPDTKLAGAEFTLQDVNGVIVKDKDGNELTGLTTDANGEIVVHDLRPGDYKFVETKAPSGYYLSTEPIEFTIERSQQEILEVTAENRRRSSGGGGGGGGGGYYPPEEDPNKPEEDPKNPVDPNTPEEEEQLDPNESEEPTTTEDSNTPEEEQQTTTEDPNTPTNQGQSGQGAGNDQQGSDHTTGNLSDNASENLPSAQDQQMNNDSRNLADSDSNAAANKKLLPQTGESLPFTTFLGLLLIIAAALILFRKESVQNK